MADAWLAGVLSTFALGACLAAFAAGSGPARARVGRLGDRGGVRALRGLGRLVGPFGRRRRGAALAAVGMVLGASARAWPLVPLLGLLGWRAPVILASARERSRLRRADAELPQLLDLLAAASSAGLAAPLALRRAVDAMEGPLANELRGISSAVDLGARWREELGRLSERLPLPDLRRMTAALTRTERLGAPLAEGLAELAARVRAERRSRAAERARTAPVKMLFPLVFLVLPAFLLLTVVPVLLTTVRSI